MSFVGKQKWAKGIGQDIFLTEKCSKNRGSIIHELGHAVGFWHEHTRTDRDNYVEILWDNIKPGAEQEFYIQPENTIDSLGVPYDYDSIMHYPLVNAFSLNGQPTMRILDPNYTGVVGQRDGLSYYDRRLASLLNGCSVGELYSTLHNVQYVMHPVCIVFPVFALQYYQYGFCL